MMASVIVGIGDCKVSKQPDDVLITHALGSCIAVMIHDPVAKVAGLLHYMLPESSLDAERARRLERASQALETVRGIAKGRA